jgi:hypothetical protein
MATWFVCNSVDGSRALLRGKITIPAAHREFRMVSIGNDLVLIEDYLWEIVDGRQRKVLQVARVADAEDGLEEWELLQDRRNSAAWYEEKPSPVLPQGVYRGAHWNDRFPFKAVTIDDVIAYATA